VPVNQRRPPGDPPRRAVMDGRLAWIHKAAAELGVLYLFPEAAVMQVRLSRSASVGSVYRRVDTEFGGIRYIRLGALDGAIPTEQFHARIRPDNAMGLSRKQWLWSPNRAGVGLTSGDAAA